jgi:hypothetical protein
MTMIFTLGPTGLGMRSKLWSQEANGLGPANNAIKLRTNDVWSGSLPLDLESMVLGQRTMALDLGTWFSEWINYLDTGQIAFSLQCETNDLAPGSYGLAHKNKCVECVTNDLDPQAKDLRSKPIALDQE